MATKLSAEQQRTRTQLKRQQTEQQHLHCEMVFLQKGPHWGMYCKQHSTWIRWVRQQELVELGVIPKPIPQWQTVTDLDPVLRSQVRRGV